MNFLQRLNYLLFGIEPKKDRNFSFVADGYNPNFKPKAVTPMADDADTEEYVPKQKISFVADSYHPHIGEGHYPTAMAKKQKRRSNDDYDASDYFSDEVDRMAKDAAFDRYFNHPL